MTKVLHYRQFSSEKINDFLEKGYKKRYFFPHEVYYLPKCGPDAYKLAQRMCGETDLNNLWEVVLYASAPTIDEFPEELFFDDDLIWHQQQFGKVGQIATANLSLDGESLYSMVHISDIVQRISRQRKFKTRIENRFKGWPYLLFNSILNFAIVNNIETIYSPTSEFAKKHTDPRRNVEKPLFERAYDRTVNFLFKAKKNSNWWEINVAENKDKVIIPKLIRANIEHEKTICLNHDIEMGLGHVGIDSKMVQEANKFSPTFLEEMLRIERELNINATYNVLGCIMNEVRERIQRDGHCISFHSYDHRIERSQLRKCRLIDYRTKGYRAPMSKLTPDLSDENLCLHNFEWLASSRRSLGFETPRLENRIVKIPILFDDYEMYEKNTDYIDWEKKAISAIKENKFVAFGLHDCYGKFWLPNYKEFLKKIRGLGVLKTMDEVASEIILSSSR